jgi:hypothetical protein
MASEITLLDEMFKIDEVDSERYDKGPSSFSFLSPLPHTSCALFLQPCSRY